MSNEEKLATAPLETDGVPEGGVSQDVHEIFAEASRLGLENKSGKTPTLDDYDHERDDGSYRGKFGVYERDDEQA